MKKEYTSANSRQDFYTNERTMNMTTTIQKWGNSQGIRLPKSLLEAIQWHDNEQINIKAENNKIVIEKATKSERKNIQELFADFDGEYTPTEIDWIKPVGKEIW